ncbi:hypothetical protein F4778DRAFT_377329 [Xylariomycetidae sp. FL2044]|nr:hypothetical protein F4778DRAFT_377329 [Xylariomycetidae sp. FL2044]
MDDDSGQAWLEYKARHLTDAHGRSFADAFAYSMWRTRRLATGLPAAMPPNKMPPGGRRAPAKGSMRNCRGAGWHRRGYRSNGCMWINVKQGSYGPVSGRDFREVETLKGFVKSVFRTWESDWQDGWYCDVFFRKKSLIRVLVDLERQGFGDHDAIVNDFFDGGETVYFKVFDQDGVQQSVMS